MTLVFPLFVGSGYSADDDDGDDDSDGGDNNDIGYNDEGDNRSITSYKLQNSSAGELESWQQNQPFNLEKLPSLRGKPSSPTNYSPAYTQYLRQRGVHVGDSNDNDDYGDLFLFYKHAAREFVYEEFSATESLNLLKFGYTS